MLAYLLFEEGLSEFHQRPRFVVVVFPTVRFTGVRRFALLGHGVEPDAITLVSLKFIYKMDELMERSSVLGVFFVKQCLGEGRHHLRLGPPDFHCVAGRTIVHAPVIQPTAPMIVAKLQGMIGCRVHADAHAKMPRPCVPALRVVFLLARSDLLLRRRSAKNRRGSDQSF